MSAAYIVTIIVALILVSLVISAISYHRQQSMARRKHLISQCLRQADEASRAVQTLVRIDPQYELLVLLQGLAVSALKTALAQAPKDPTLEQQINQQFNLLTHFQEGKRSNQIENYCSNDTLLRQAHLELIQISKIIEIFQNQNKISTSKAQQLKHHLQYLNLAIDVNSHVHQANCFAEKNDVILYQTHIKQARDALKKSSLDLANKNQQIDKLTEILNEARRSNAMSVVKSEL